MYLPNHSASSLLSLYRPISHLSVSSCLSMGMARKEPSCPSRPTLMLGLVEGGGGRGGGGGGGSGVVTGTDSGPQP